MAKKSKNSPRKIPTPLYLIACIVTWWLVWILTQALFMIDVPFLSDYLSRSENTTVTFATYTAWICAVGGIATFLWSRWSGRDFSFLRTRKWRWIVLGYLPVLAVAAFIMATRSIFDIPGWLWAPSLLATTFFQDILTFGFLQTALARRIKPFLAALLTAAVFFAGHFWLVGKAPSLTDPQVYLFAIGFPVMALLRWKTKTIYVTNMFHSAFHMVSGI